jgi:hypothetical protein
MDRRRASVSAFTVAVRTRPANMPYSPRRSPGPSARTGSGRPEIHTLSRPLATRYTRSLGSPCSNSTSPSRNRSVASISANTPRSEAGTSEKTGQAASAWFRSAMPRGAAFI